MFAHVLRDRPSDQRRGLSNTVDFINKDNCVLSAVSLFKQAAYAARADADEQFNEFRTGDRKNGTLDSLAIALANNVFSGAGQTHQQYASRDFCAYFQVAVGVFKNQ